jgi:tryptophan synthase alpha chain
MTTTLRQKLTAVKDSGKKVLSFFITAGYPRRGDTVNIVRSLAENGADMVELGIAFSDPIADGPVIQAASEQALRGGITLRHTLDLAAEIRKHTPIPIVLMGYANPIFRFGMAQFFSQCAAIGIDGTIIPDVPLEESGEYRELAGDCGVAPIFLAAPTSSDDRLRQLDEASQGFLYCVSITGVTGAREGLPAQASDFLRRARGIVTKNPLIVGFGVAKPADAVTLCKFADGVIIGSSLLKHIGSLSSQAIAKEAGVFARSFRAAVDKLGD